MFSSFERMMALRYFRARRGEKFISIITGFSLVGITLGVATLIIVMSVMNGFRTELLDRILGINAHVTVTASGVPAKNYNDLQHELARVVDVHRVYPVINGEVMASHRGMHSGAVVRGYRKEDMATRPLISKSIIAGKLDDFEGVNTVMLGSRLANRLLLDVGDSITLISPQTTATVLGSIPRLKEYTIVGLVEIGMYEFDSATIYMPLEAAQLYFKLPEAVNGFELFINTPDNAPEVAQLTEQKLGGRPFFVSDWKAANSHYFNALKVERVTMFVILTLIIVIAAFNIISSLIMLVNDKTRDIAILRTIGASRGSVMRIFFMTGAAIGVLGTALGFGLGVAFALNIEHIRRFIESMINQQLFPPEVYFLSQLPAEIHNSDIINVVLIALALSFVATLYPAWRAAKVHPAEGVRSE